MDFTRKYRPINFDTYIGNEVSKRKMMNMLKKGTVPHSSIFQGDRGCGKTTLARIVGKSLLCKNPVDGIACDECSNCKKINEKFIINGGKVPGIPIVEIDINNDGKKEDVLSLIQEMRTKPIGSNRKVYILDEIQVMSKKAQSSLLKILEEPNEWLYIILCTTDPDDLIVPLRSRLTPFKISRPTIQDIKKTLIHICQEEGIKYDEKALELIIKVSNRIPRESIKNLEYIASSGDVLYEIVQKDLQMVKLDTYIDYINSMNKEIFDALEFIEKIKDIYDIEIEDFLDGLAEFMVDSFNIRMGVSLEKYTEEEAKRMRKVFKAINTKQMIRFLNLIEDALKLKNNPRYALTMLTLKMGFPEYFKSSFTKEEIEEEKKKEEIISVKNYRDNKKKQKQNILQENKEVDLNIIQDLFPDSFIVENNK